MALGEISIPWMLVEFVGRWCESDNGIHPDPVHISKISNFVFSFPFRCRRYGISIEMIFVVHSSVSHLGINTGGLVMISKSQNGCVPSIYCKGLDFSTLSLINSFNNLFSKRFNFFFSTREISDNGFLVRC